MRKVFVIFGVVLLVLACKNKSNDISKTELRTDIINEINLIERDLHADLYLDYDKAKNALNAYDKFINAFPNDSLSAEYLFRSAEIALALNNVNLAKTNLANIVYNYKTYVNYELSIFYLAHTFQNHLFDADSAKFYYEKYLNEFPDTDLAEEIKSIIETLYLTDVELIRSFEKMNE